MLLRSWLRAMLPARKNSRNTSSRWHYRKRTLFKMDLSEAIYISELRTGAAGHFSYRNVAYAMYEAVAQRYPASGPVFSCDRRARASGFTETLMPGFCDAFLQGVSGSVYSNS